MTCGIFPLSSCNLAHVQLVFISGLAIPVAIVLFNRCNCCVFFGTYFVSKTYFRQHYLISGGTLILTKHNVPRSNVIKVSSLYGNGNDKNKMTTINHPIWLNKLANIVIFWIMFDFQMKYYQIIYICNYRIT